MTQVDTPVAPAVSRADPAPDKPPALEVEGLIRRFGGVRAVDGFSLALHPGELLALVGPSGCGKSTVLRVVAGLLEPDAGSVVLDGAVVSGPGTRVPPEQREVGIVFQDPALFPNLTVARNVAFGLREESAAGRRERVGEVLRLVELADHAERYPHELSGGERQRVALARSLAPRPAVMLLDEPFANLDQRLRVQLRGEVVSILRATGTPAVFVTHDQQEALAVGDRVAVMRDGRLLQVDSPAAVFHRPASRFVARFMGEASFLPVEGCDAEQLWTEAGPCPAPPVRPPSGASVMVRPHEVRIRPEPAGSARILASRFQGAFNLYDLELASGRRLQALESHVLHLEPGTRVSVELTHGHPPAVLAAPRATDEDTDEDTDADTDGDTDDKDTDSDRETA